ncbi:MAG: ubiquitin-like domain-containing protein [Chloroflexi bacterium]|nr:ubiquitin-like domain-containing protein [Chloroflexota bacterium]
MTPVRIRLIALIAALLVLLAGYLSLNREVTILVDNQAIKIVTRAPFVWGALSSAGVELHPKDDVEPSKFVLLRDEMIIAVRRASTVHLLMDGEYYEGVSSMRDPNNLLASFNAEMGVDDRLLLFGQTHSMDEELPILPLLLLEVKRPVAITLIIDEESQQFFSSAPTLGEALQAEGIEVLASDHLDKPLTTLLVGSLTARLTRSVLLEINSGGEEIVVRSSASTVGEALAEVGIALQNLDFSRPADDQPIPADRRIRVVRVRESVERESELLPFSVEWQPDSDLEIDGRSVVQVGQNGLLASSVRVRFEDGKEVSRREEGEWVLAEPVVQISGYGTDIVVRTAVVDGVTIEYWRTLSLYATSYSPCRSGTSKCYYYTALGDEVKKGIAAVYLSWWYAMGNHTVYVPGYGAAKISDNGAYPDGRPWIDLGYSDADWVTWAQWVTVYFTTPIPPANEILYILP